MSRRTIAVLAGGICLLLSLWGAGLPLSHGDCPPSDAIKVEDTPILMAEYYITLTDPLPSEMHNLKLAISRLTGAIVEPGEVFSQNQALGPYTSERGYQDGHVYLGATLVMLSGGGVCKIASLLYNVTILSDLPVIERHNHSKTVPYVPLGQDATVYFGAKDLRFLNDTSGPIAIQASVRDNTLHMALYGHRQPPSIDWSHETLERTAFWTVYRTNPDLPKGSERLVMPGQDGCLIRSRLNVRHQDGRVEDRDLGVNWYDVLPEVIERGPP